MKLSSFKLFLEKISYPMYYRLHINEQKRRIRIGKNKLLQRFQIANFTDFYNCKKSDTFFILGSGASICSYNKDMWDIIKKHDSVGINFWLVHDFVPDLYSIEVSESGNSQKMKCLHELLDLKKDLYKNTLIYIKDVWRTSTNIFNIIPEQLWENTYIGEDYEIPGETMYGFRRSIKSIDTSNRHLEKLILWKKKASISMWIYYAFIMGYKNIVLCGVDLNNVDYFYEKNAKYYKKKGVPIPEKDQFGIVHKTMDSQYGEVTVDYIVNEINSTLLKTAGRSLYIGSKTSALYPKLPYYWDSYL